ncbi:MAG: hypothetical protein ACTHK1_07655 [Actinomycetales bacterium]
MSSPSVVLQARVPRELADAVARDLPVLGLAGTSEAVREGLELLHRRAEQVRLAQAYDDFYGHAPAPLTDVTQALWGHDSGDGREGADDQEGGDGQGRQE